MRTRKIYHTLVTLSLVGLLTACGGGGGGGGDDAPAAVTSAGAVSVGVSKGDTVTGGVTKGPVNGATVLFYPVDQFGFPLTTEIASARTNAAGNFTVTLPAGAGTVLVESFGGSFIDEADRAGNRVIQLGPNEGFSSILPNGSARVAINPVTDTLVLRSRDLAASEGGFGGIFNTNRATFASQAGFDAFTTVPANPTSPAAGASLAEKQYALLLGGLANAINVLTVELGLAEPTYEVIKAVIFDLVDGEFNGLKYGEPVRVQGANGVQNLATDIDFNAQVTRFKNNNAAAYTGTAAPIFRNFFFANRLPTANAGVDRTVASGELVTLDGSASSDPEGGLSYNWVQTAGPTVSLTGATTAKPTFTAPNILDGSGVVAFTLTVTDAANATAIDDVIMNVTRVALPRKFAAVDQGVYGGGIGENIDGGAVVTLNSDGSGTVFGDNGTVAIQYTITSGNSIRINYPPGYVEESFSRTVADPSSGSDIVIQIEVRPAFIDLTVAQDLANADVVEAHTEGQLLSSDARFQIIVFTEDIVFTAYDFAKQIPFVVEDKSERMLKVNLSPQIAAAASSFDRDKLHEDILVFNADGTGTAEYSALSFLWAIQADGHLRVTYSTGDIADYYHLASGPSGDIVSTDMRLVTPLVAGADNLINDLGLSFKRTATRPILTTDKTPGIYSGLFVLDEQKVLLSYRLNPDFTGGVEVRQTLSDGTVKWQRSNLSLCWGIGEDNALVTRSGIDGESFSEGFRESSPTFCSSLDGSKNVVTSSSDLELFSIVGEQYRFHNRFQQAGNLCTGLTGGSDCENGPLLLAGSVPEVVTKEILTAVPPLPVDDFLDFDPTGTSSVTVDVLSNDITRELPIDTTTVQIVVPPSTGAATVDPLNGAITFTFARDANVQETIQYRVADTEGNRSSVGSLSITINLVPTANAGVDQTAVSGATVTLDGSASNDLEGPVTYSWVQIDAGPKVSLSNATAVNPTFAAALGDAVLEFALTVTADDGATATDTVTVTLTNVLPKANAGVDQTVASGVTATLDGSASNDLEGLVSYSWVQSSGTPVTLNDATVVNPTFSAAIGDAVLEFTLTVTDDDDATATDTVIVTLTSLLPTANAGVDQTVAVGATVTLDGSASNHLEGLVSYSWVQRRGGRVTLSDVTVVNPTFVVTPFAALGGAVLEFSLTVTDVNGGTATDSVVVTLTNVLPTANAGVDQTAVSGATVTLDGSASNDLEGAVIFNWVQSSGSAVTLSGATAANPTFAAALGDAVLEFSLTVTDDDGAKATDSVIVTLTNVLPTANAGVDQAAVSGATVTLDGSASNDLEGVVTYSWVQISGTAVTLNDATVVNPTFAAALGDAVLEFSLTVTDDDGATALDTVIVTLTNALPTANAGVDQTVASGATVTLDGSASNDLEGVVTYSWVQIDAGTQVRLSDAATVNPTFTAALGDAVLEFTLTVTDDDGATATDTVTVTLTNVLPTANAGIDQTAVSGATVTLDGSASNDLEGAVSYSWVQSSGTAVTLSGATVVNPTFTAALGDAVLEFTLTVTDDGGATATDYGHRDVDQCVADGECGC